MALLGIGIAAVSAVRPGRGFLSRQDAEPDPIGTSSGND